MTVCVAVISGSEVEESVILSSIAEATQVTGGSIVKRCLIQHGVRVSGHALVRESLLMEHSSVEQEGKVRDPWLSSAKSSSHDPRADCPDLCGC
jgi:ADP-glucose pyrophosphorylase